MRKLIVSTLAMMMCVAVACAADDWREKKADQDDYLEDKVAIAEANKAGDDELVYKLELALSTSDHCERFPIAKAWRLNNAAHALINMHKKDGIDKLKLALELLKEADELKKDAACAEKIKSNIEYCEYHLKK